MRKTGLWPFRGFKSDRVGKYIIKELEYKVISVCQKYIKALSGREVLQKREANVTFALLSE